METSALRNDLEDKMIIVSDLTKSFRIYSDKSHTFKDRVLFRRRNRHERHEVLHGISFSASRGQAIGLIGHNGCGKSTTLKLLNRIIYPDSGSIVMKGRISSLIELGAGFHPDMTGRENIYINATIFGLKRKEIDQRLEDIIRFSELEQYIDNPVRTYSSGMYMRLAFAIAINVDADILLVDEILAVGDANFQKKCFDKLTEIKNNGITIVIVSHNMDQIKSICDCVLWLENGEIQEEGDASIVCEEYLKQMRDKAEERTLQENREKEIPEDANVKYPPYAIAGSQTSKFVHRNGNMKIRFSVCSLENHGGKKKQTFRCQEQMVVSFELISEDETSMADIIFNIFDHKDGHLCTTFGTRIHCGTFIPIRHLLKSKLIIENINLCEGDYILDALIEDSFGQVCDRLTHMIEFHVDASGKFGIGTAAMNSTWGFINKEGELLL